MSLGRWPGRPTRPTDPRALAQEIAHEARARGGLLLFVDYEGTLCSRRPDRQADGLPLLARAAVVTLVAAPSTRVVVVSGHDARDLESRVGVPGVIHAGCRGLQVRGAGLSFSHPVAAGMKDMLPVLAGRLSDTLAVFRGVEVEIKEVGVTVDARRADPSVVPMIVARTEQVRWACALEFRVWRSGDAVDLLPDVGWPLGFTARWGLEQWACEGHGQPTIVFLGDDVVEEAAEPARRGYGYAVHVGPLAGTSPASHWVADRPAAIDLLAEIALAWGRGSPDR